MHVPPELLQSIVQHLERRDLKRLRLTCKGLAENIIPHLFNSVFLSHDCVDCERALLALSHFGPQLEEVVVSPLEYRDYSLKEYKSQVRSNSGYERMPWRSRFDQHAQVGYGIYCEIRTKCHSLESKELLAKILTEAPNIRRVEIAHRNRVDDAALVEYCYWDQCSKRCSLSYEQHSMFQLTPIQSHSSTQTLDLSCYIETIVLYSTAKMKELSMEHNVTRHPFHNSEKFFQAHTTSFRNLEREKFNIAGFTANLTKLRLNVGTNPHAKEREHTILTKILLLAQNLECLFLETLGRDWNERYLPGPIPLEGGQLPRLRVLVLTNGTATGRSLLSILQNLPRLKHLVLESFTLEDFFWSDLIESIKKTTSIEELHLNYVTGRYDSSNQTKRLYTDCEDRIMRYLHQGGPNPFARAVDEMGTGGVIPEHPVRGKAQEYHERYF